MASPMVLLVSRTHTSSTAMKKNKVLMIRKLLFVQLERKGGKTKHIASRKLRSMLMKKLGFSPFLLTVMPTILFPSPPPNASFNNR